MGNSSSSSGRNHQDDTVDFGYLVPQGVYTGPRDWNQAIVAQLIGGRRLAPFYRPLDDYDDSWDDDQILAARKEPPDANQANGDSATRVEVMSTSSSIISSKSSHSKRPSLKEPAKPEASIYRGAVECPICFLYYPPNINHSRCCDQAICTECFVQIKRSEPTTTHLVSEPAACPYCVQDNFGIVYTPPPWRAGLGSDGSPLPWANSHSSAENPPTPTHKRRQKSFGADNPEVVTIDHIRPDWEAKLAAVRAAVTRRANRRIIMRQVGDRLIPVGVTSGRLHALSPEEAANAGELPEPGSGSRRSRRRQQGGGGNTLDHYIGLGGQDLEELMVMEAMRLSLLDHEEQQRKEAEEKRKKAAVSSQEAELSSGAGSSTLPVPSSSEPGRASPATISSTSSGNREPASPAPEGRRSISVDVSPPSRHSRHPSSSNGNPTTAGSPSFKTLGAALSAASSTASAVISTSGTSTPTVPQTEQSPERPAEPAPAAVPAAVSNAPKSAEEDSSAASRPIPVHQDTQMSVLTVDTEAAGSSYDQLLSSPESAVDRRPLLPSDRSDTDSPQSLPSPRQQ